jgi:predicted metal-binding membrane protein
MESATLHRPPLSGQIQAGLVALLLAFAIGGWVLTDERMAGMDMGPGGELGGLGWFLGVWVVMMAAMMFPSISPMVVAFAGVQAARRPRSEATGLTAVFIAGYLVVWSSVGFAGYLLIELVRSWDPGFLAWDTGGPYVTGGVIVAAALYQLSPLKDACLRHCRDPKGFLAEHWQPGAFGSLRMGLEHGGYCVGCCWALMVVLFALGVMSLTWMAFVAALIAGEKLLPSPAVTKRGVAVLLAALGLAVALAPEDVPRLTIPGSPEAIRAMEAMGMESMDAGGAMGGMESTHPAGAMGMDDRMEKEPAMPGGPEK